MNINYILMKLVLCSVALAVHFRLFTDSNNLVTSGDQRFMHRFMLNFSANIEL